MNNGLNELHIIGNVVRDAELKNVDIEGTPTPRCRFSVAVNDSRNNKETATYFDVAAWREYATKIAPWVLKGRKVFVSGSVKLNQYVSNNTMRCAMQIHNPTVILLDDKPEINVKSIEELDDDELPFG